MSRIVNYYTVLPPTSRQALGLWEVCGVGVGVGVGGEWYGCKCVCFFLIFLLSTFTLLYGLPVDQVIMVHVNSVV